MVKDTLLSSATNSEQATPLVPLEFDRGSITLPVAVERGAMELNSCAEINRYTLGSDGRSAAIALGSKVIAIQAAQRTLRNFLTFFHVDISFVFVGNDSPWTKGTGMFAISAVALLWICWWFLPASK